MWLQEQIPTRHVFKKIKLHAQNMITILGSIVTKVTFYDKMGLLEKNHLRPNHRTLI